MIAAAFGVALASANCGSSGTTYTTPSTPARCAVTTTVTPSTLPAAGGTASIAVSTERECQWTATSDGAWLKVMSGASGQGPGTVSVSASANADPAGRTASVAVNDQRVQLSQAAAACDFSLGETSASVPQTGGSGRVDVRASSALCDWTASSQDSWITITSGATGKGSGTVAFDAAATTGPARSGSLKIAGITFTVNQSAGCGYSITPSTFSTGVNGGSTAVTVTTGATCPWTTSSSAGWITVRPPSGNGGGLVTVDVAPSDGAGRTGSATIAGQPFTVTQAAQACTVAISPPSVAVPAAGGSARIDVTAPSGCPWTAVSQASWIGITSGAGGSGNGAVQLAIAANSGADRSGTVTVGSQTFTVAQSGSCTFTLSPGSQTVGAAAAAGAFTLNTAAGCAWSAAATADWITVLPPTSGVGTASVQFTVAANTGAARSGTITAGGQAFTITQASGCTFTISPLSQDIPDGGGKGSVSVKTTPSCTWAAASTVAWITLSGPVSGSGSGMVKFEVDKNPKGSDPRVGTIAIADQLFTVNQHGGL
jgi:Putative binding domain, N-terminal/Viral BACON domain